VIAKGSSELRQLDPKKGSNFDYLSKATTYGASNNNQSVGLTPDKVLLPNSDEKEAQERLYNNKHFMEPSKAMV
jgi:hypothetical protein